MSGVGFVGLGQIGAPMATRLLAWPEGLTVFDVVPAATERFAAKGARVAASPGEVAQHADVISIMVRDDAQVTEVLTGPDGILSTARPGTVARVLPRRVLMLLLGGRLGRLGVRGRCH